MEVFVTIVRYDDSYRTTLTEVWFDEKTARNRCRIPLYHSGDVFEVESYELYKARLDAHNLLEKGGTENAERTV